MKRLPEQQRRELWRRWLLPGVSLLIFAGAGGSLTAQAVAGGHHFGGNYDALAAAILKHVGIAAGSETTVR